MVVCGTYSTHPSSPLRHGGAYKCLKILLRHKLVHHDGTKYDGYRLTNMGYDFLAIKVCVWGGGCGKLLALRSHLPCDCTAPM